MECNDTLALLQSRVCKEIYNLPTFLQYNREIQDVKGKRGKKEPVDIGVHQDHQLQLDPETEIVTYVSFFVVSGLSV